MKISKLFHWLYAFLMLLPCFFIGANAIYYGFNDNAVSQTYTKEVPTYYETNEIYSLADFVVGRVYRYNGSSYNGFASDSLNLFSIRITSNLPFANLELIDNLSVYYSRNSSQIVAEIFYSNDTHSYVNISNLEFDFVLESKNVSFDYLIYSDFSASTMKIQSGIELYSYSNGIVDSLVEATERTFELPMFSWTNDNFIVAPFAYLSGLFGIQSGNVFVLFLDYWATISIIYLCFDIVMYVPLLAHRWIDKAVIE